ncbi:SRC2-like protein [Cardamine amara subsp. amara]|uniref:SRC2-like protein n=1 Tax=Cardamine amara subsp. amara TaxID=228776 RepID=A0ABD1BSV1_CARAN
MANLTLELNIYSAKDLENVNLITKMDVYAVVSINGDDSQKNHKEKTPIDRTGESEPTWNHAVKFSVNQRLAREGRLTLVVKLVCDRIFGDKDLGEVQVPILELLCSSPSFNGNGNGQGTMRFVTYQVRIPSGKGQGSLTFSYRFDSPSFKPELPVSSPFNPNPINTPGDLPSTTYPPSSESGLYPSLASIGYPPSSQPLGYSAPPYRYDSPYPEQPVTCYPPPSPSNSNLYPPPPHHQYPPPHHQYPPPSGHSYHQVQPSQSFHGYAPSSPQNQYEYGYPPPPRYGYGCPTTQAPRKENKSGIGLGLGAGLLGGVLGGLVIGDLVSDIGFDF